jgi:methylmalonyl-CoA mutase
MPVFGTMASRFNDDGVTALYQALLPRLAALGLKLGEGRLPRWPRATARTRRPSCRRARVRYLADIADTVRGYKRRAREQATLAREVQQLRERRACCTRTTPTRDGAKNTVLRLAEAARSPPGPAARKLLAMWPDMQQGLCRRRIRGEDPRQGNPHRADHTTLSGNKIRKVALPQYEDHGELLKWLLLDNVPGSFPYTAGTFAFKRENEDPTRMFAGEGDAFRTNRRFKLVSEGMPAKR